MKTKPFLPVLAVLSILLCGASNITLEDVETAIIEEDYKRVQDLAQDFIEGEPQKTKLDKALYYLGLGQLRDGSYWKARETFNKLIDNFPDLNLRDKAYIGLIDTFYLQNEFEGGLRFAYDIYKLSPDSNFLNLIYMKLARGNLKLARWKKAGKYLKKIRREFPDSFESHLAKQLLEEKNFFTVQVGAFLERWRADKLKEELINMNEYAYIIETVDYEGRKFYRVRVGKLTSLNEAEKLESKLSRLGYPTRIYP